MLTILNIIETILIAIVIGCVIGAVRLWGYMLLNGSDPMEMDRCCHYTSVWFCALFAVRILAYTGLIENAGIVFRGIAALIIALIIGYAMLAVRVGGAYSLNGKGLFLNPLNWDWGDLHWTR